jgi:hypothetical protein
MHSKRSVIIALLICVTACTNTSPQKTIRICNSDGCADRPHDYSSLDLETKAVTEDTGKMASLEKLAAQDPRAAYDLALRFFRGDGVRQDTYRSIKWMRDAAERGDLNAQKALGRLYLTGLGEMGADPGEAEKWLSITVAKGDQEAAILLEEATQARRSNQEEYRWFNRWRSTFYNDWYYGYPYNWYWGLGGWSLDAPRFFVDGNIAGTPISAGEEPNVPMNGLRHDVIGEAPGYKAKPLQTQPFYDERSSTVATQGTPARTDHSSKPQELPPASNQASSVAVKPASLSTAGLDNSKHERRVALVIGNSAYRYTGQLANPTNDAEDIAQALKKYNFQVILKTNADLETMADAVYQFGENLKGGGVGLFYYSGHGLQVKGENYLLPIDANLTREDDVKRKAISANDVVEKMGEGNSHLNLVFLDACRNNPFPSNIRAVSRGLIGMNAPNGTLLVFSTSPDNVALDGSGRNGTYTKHLLQQIDQPGLEIGMMLRKIRTAVKEETGGQQVPWENGSIEGEFYFKDGSP